jgi:hypothetical protein
MNFAQELLGLQPDIILANGAAVTAALQRETPTIPIVFVGLGDPVASGLVPRLANPVFAAVCSSFALTRSHSWVQLETIREGNDPDDKPLPLREAVAIPVWVARATLRARPRIA